MSISYQPGVCKRCGKTLAATKISVDATQDSLAGDLFGHNPQNILIYYCQTCDIKPTSATITSESELKILSG